MLRSPFVPMANAGPALALCFALGLSACGGGGDAARVEAPAGPVSVPGTKLSLKNFSGPGACAEFGAYLAESFTDQFLSPIVCLAIGPCPVFLGAPGAASAPAAGASEGAMAADTPGRVSQTTTQEAGVDEGDLVKADSLGNLYLLTDRKLVVLDAFPPAGLSSRPQAQLDLAAVDTGFYAHELILDEPAQRLVVLGSSWSGSRPRSVAVIVDVANPAAPVELSRVSIDGYPMLTRRIGARLTRVSRYEIPLPQTVWDDAALQQWRADYSTALAQGRSADASAIRQRVRDSIGGKLSASGVESYLPVRGSGPDATPLACSDIARPEVQTGASLVVLESFNTDGTAHAASGAINNAFIAYASPDNLYLAQNSTGWFFDARQVDESVIYRFALSATGAPAYQGFGRVPGSLLNGYALSEHAGFLRVASTEVQWTDSRVVPENHLSVLRASGVDLPRVGHLGGFGAGEFIRGNRLLGTRGFVVTFRQVDPLFAFDLSDPLAPRILDELKIPGFSSYLMPLGADYLLTIGRGGDEERLNGQVAVQLFDIANLADIRQVDVIEAGFGDGSFSWSAAEYDPHAFSYFADSAAAPVPGTLSVPVQVYSPDQGFSGFLVLRVDPAAGAPLSELSRLDHRGFAAQNECSADGAPVPCANAVYAAEPRRSVFMQDEAGTYLYTISALGVLASDAASPLTELGRAVLPYDPPQCCFVEPATGGGTTGP